MEAVNDTVAEVLDDVVADTPVGADGIVVIDVDAVEAEDVPPEFVAVTVNVYAVPAVNPLTVIGDVVPVPVKP